MTLAGIEIDDRAVLMLAALLHDHGFEHTAIRLGRAYDAVARDVGLTIEESEQVLVALEDPPEQLAPLRAVLLQEHVGRVRDGLR